MRRLATALLLAAVAAPASALCLPPPAGVPEPPVPTIDEVAIDVDRYFTDIAYGVVVSQTGRPARFKIIHVYKGGLKPGQVIRGNLEQSVMVGPNLPCLDVSWRPVPKGDYGVIAYRDTPALRFVADDVIHRMIALGLITSARSN